MGIELYSHQLDAVKKLKNGCILCGGVGSGKSRTSLTYYYICNGGDLNTPSDIKKVKIGEGEKEVYCFDYIPMDDVEIKDLFIITTARKRDTLEWEGELTPFLLSPHKEINLYSNKVTIDSWNNIGRYKDVKNAFFIFDEQRVIGSGSWVKTFLEIVKLNNWILLSATPGDTWMDYIPVFLANGFYKNRTEFVREHVIYSRFSKFPKVDRYLNTGKLLKLRRQILVNMEFKRDTISRHEDIYVDYDTDKFKQVMKTRKNPFTNQPIKNAGELCYILRKVVNSDKSRQIKLLELLEKHPKAIIFYNFDYELEILQDICVEVNVAQWNGHKHEPIPNSEQWVYLVQYTAGNEGWNCVETDTVIFYSQNYSYKVMTQAAGRIDRLNTPFKDLYYYHLKSRSGIDLAISKALKEKKNFNESKWLNTHK